MAGSALIGNEDETCTVLFEAEGAEGNEAGVDGRGCALVDGEVFLAIGVKDVDGHFGIARRRGGVSDANLVAPRLGDGGCEGGGALALGGFAIVDVAGADEVRETGGLDPGANEFGLGIVEHDAGKLVGGDGFVRRQGVGFGLEFFDLGRDVFEPVFEGCELGFFGPHLRLEGGVER
jgi:hypothetical protein